MSKKIIVELSDGQYEHLQSIPYGSIGSRIILDRVKKGVPFEDREKGTDKDKGEISDGYHTFNQLYHQRAVLFAALVKLNKDKAWKSFKHSDGKYCFDEDGEMFIVGIDTPEGSYTYHYHKKYWDMFDCIELEVGKLWDGHTEDDVTRLLSLSKPDREKGEWIEDHEVNSVTCKDCGCFLYPNDIEGRIAYCPTCGRDMR